MNDERVPPPPPPSEPRFPGRNRLAAIAGAIGLIALAAVLLTLPTGEPITSTILTTVRPMPTTIAPEAPSLATPALHDSATAPHQNPPAPAAATAPAPSEIVVTVQPRAAVVRLDGRTVSRRRLTVSPGHHVLNVAADGYVARTDTVMLTAGQQFTWSPKLAPAMPSKSAPGKVASAPEPPRRANPDDAACATQIAASAWPDAYQTCTRAATSGSAIAARHVATLFRRGAGVRRSDDSASRWFAQGARGGDVESMFQLAAAYDRGRGISKDQVAAVDWYTRAAAAGHADAQFALGDALEHGRLGLAKDRAKALEWYRKAAAQGQKDAAARVRDLDR